MSSGGFADFRDEAIKPLDFGTLGFQGPCNWELVYLLGDCIVVGCLYVSGRLYSSYALVEYLGSCIVVGRCIVVGCLSSSWALVK